MQADSTTGLTTRTASVLAYLGWWVTGLIFWGVERRDRLVRFHAIQSTLAFGLLAAAMLCCGAVGLVTLSFAPAAFTVFTGAALLLWGAALLLWAIALWKAGHGARWRMPWIAALAERWAQRADRAAGPQDLTGPA